MTPSRLPRQAQTTGCPVTERGIYLSAACVACQGSPSGGQRKLDRGDILFLQGAVADRMYAVVSGWLREYVLDADGTVGGARLVRAGHVVGLDALGARAGATYSVTVEAMRPATVCVLGAQRTGAWLLKRPVDALALTVAVTEDLARLRSQMIANASIPAEERVLALITDVASDCASGAWFQFPGTRAQLGEVLGLTIETVSRMIQRLARAGHIEVSGSRVRLC